jgi:hypothetical protein
MRFLRLKFWLARRSKWLDRKFTKQFWNEYIEMVRNVADTTGLDTKDINLIKRK